MVHISLHANYSDNCFQNLTLMGVMHLGAMRAGTSWSLLDLDARRRYAKGGVVVIGKSAVVTFVDKLD